MNPKTMRYILKRLLLAILTVWVVITVTFFVMRAVPGGRQHGELLGITGNDGPAVHLQDMVVAGKGVYLLG